MNELNSALPARLRASIERSGLSIREFSGLAGLPYRTLQNYLAGDRLPGAEALAQIAGAGVDLNWLVTGQAVQPPEYTSEAPDHLFVSLASAEPDKEQIRTRDSKARQRQRIAMQRSGIFDFIVRAAASTADDLNAKHVSDTGESMPVIDLVNSLTYFSKLHHAVVVRSLEMIDVPPKEIDEGSKHQIPSMIEIVLVAHFGDDAREAIRRMIALYIESVTTA